MKFRFTISTKIFLGFFIIILLTILFLGYLRNESKSIVSKFSEEVDPSLSAVNEFSRLVIESKMYITNWVYLPSSLEDKEALVQIQRYDYPKMKARIIELRNNWSHQNIKKMQEVFANMTSLPPYKKK